jgi:hypothetical protein
MIPPVHDRPDLVQAWDDMKRTVHKHLDRSDATRGEMAQLALFRCGLRMAGKGLDFLQLISSSAVGQHGQIGLGVDGRFADRFPRSLMPMFRCFFYFTFAIGAKYL